MISVVSQHVIGFTCHNESILIGLFRRRQFADERKWLFVSADVRGAGKRDETLRTSTWEANLAAVLDFHVFVVQTTRLKESNFERTSKNLFLFWTQNAETNKM